MSVCEALEPLFAWTNLQQDNREHVRFTRNIVGHEMLRCDDQILTPTNTSTKCSNFKHSWDLKRLLINIYLS